MSGSLNWDKIPLDAIAKLHLKPSEFVVLEFIIKYQIYSNNSDGKDCCWCNQSYLSEKLGWGRMTIYRAFKSLESKGIIKCVGNEKGKVKHYEVDDELMNLAKPVQKLDN